ncbi:MAG: FtsH protease activity modulator HflK [Acidobacteria bacterium]|nr:FtsH protease activity modulator HflK [Acidobacteriota bacterium]
MARKKEPCADCSCELSENKPEKKAISPQNPKHHWNILKLLRFLPLAVLVIWVLSGFYIVNQDEAAVVMQFGKVTDPYVTPGIRWHMPWPIESILKVKTAEMKRISIGYKIIDSLEGIPPDPLEVQRLTADTNILQIKIMVQYQITNPVDYLFNINGPHWLIREFGEAALTSIISSMKVDDVLTTGKLEIQNYVRAEIQKKLDDLHSGIIIKSCNLQEAYPPDEVVDAFNDVARAKSDRERIKSEADSYRNEILPKARGRAQEILNSAYSYQSEVVNRAGGEAKSFLEVLAEYRKAPAITRERLFLEIVEQVLPRAKMVIIEDKPTAQGKAVIIK